VEGNNWDVVIYKDATAEFCLRCVKLGSTRGKERNNGLGVGPGCASAPTNPMELLQLSERGSGERGKDARGGEPVVAWNQRAHLKNKTTQDTFLTVASCSQFWRGGKHEMPVPLSVNETEDPVLLNVGKGMVEFRKKGENAGKTLRAPRVWMVRGRVQAKWSGSTYLVEKQEAKKTKRKKAGQIR